MCVWAELKPRATFELEREPTVLYRQAIGCLRCSHTWRVISRAILLHIYGNVFMPIQALICPYRHCFSSAESRANLLKKRNKEPLIQEHSWSTGAWNSTDGDCIVLTSPFLPPKTCLPFCPVLPLVWLSNGGPAEWKWFFLFDQGDGRDFVQTLIFT